MPGGGGGGGGSGEAADPSASPDNPDAGTSSGTSSGSSSGSSAGSSSGSSTGSGQSVGSIGAQDATEASFGGFGLDAPETAGGSLGGRITGLFSRLDSFVQSKDFDAQLGQMAQFSTLGQVSKGLATAAEAVGLDGPDGTGDPSDAGGADIGPPGTAAGEGGEPGTAPSTSTPTPQQQAAQQAQAEAEVQAKAEAEAAAAEKAAAEKAARQKALDDEKKRRDAAEKEAESKARQRAKKDADDAKGAVGLGVEGGFMGGRRVRTTPLGLFGVKANVFRPTLLGG